MGMDVYGKAPRSPAGEEFSANVFRWHPLADFCQSVAPEVCEACEHWHTNDGDGLDNDGAIALSLALQAAVNANAALAYERKHGAPSVETVIRFIAFLRDSGGFQIS